MQFLNIVKIFALWCALVVCTSGQAQAASASLTWVDNASTEDGFTLERQLNGGAFTVLFTAIGANLVSYTDSTLVQGTVDNVYCYRVSAFNTAGSSAYSNTACKTIPRLLTAPTAPSNLTISATTNSSISLAWADRADNEDGYRWFRTAMTGSGSSGSGMLLANATQFTSTSLRKNTPYCFNIEAYNTMGVSESNPPGVCARTRK